MAALWAALLVGCAAAYESVAVFELAAETDYTFTTAINVKVSVVGVGLDSLDYFALDEAKTAAAAGVSTCTNAASIRTTSRPRPAPRSPPARPQ